MIRVNTLPLIFLLLAPVASSAQQTTPPEPPVVVTSGEGLVQAVPDRAWITVTAESRAGNPRDAQRRNAAGQMEIRAQVTLTSTLK